LPVNLADTLATVIEDGNLAFCKVPDDTLFADMFETPYPSPEKLAVTLLTKIAEGSLAVFNVPIAILDALRFVRADPSAAILVTLIEEGNRAFCRVPVDMLLAFNPEIPPPSPANWDVMTAGSRAFCRVPIDMLDALTFARPDASPTMFPESFVASRFPRTTTCAGAPSSRRIFRLSSVSNEYKAPPAATFPRPMFDEIIRHLSVICVEPRFLFYNTIFLYDKKRPFKNMVVFDKKTYY
jgi:hypothetical protein